MYVNFEKYVDVTSGATYYHADYVNPRWKLERVDQIGHHIFYRSAKDEINRSRNIYSE
jgi:spore germination cell wall hydrolase CwlJ-like protein